MGIVDSVIQKSKKYGLKVNVISECSLEINDKKILTDQWIVIINHDSMTLKHINKTRGKIAEKNLYHLQKKFSLDEYEAMLRYVKNHNRKSIKNRYNQPDRIDKILKKYNKNLLKRNYGCK